MSLAPAGRMGIAESLPLCAGGGTNWWVGGCENPLSPDFPLFEGNIPPIPVFSLRICVTETLTG